MTLGAFREKLDGLVRRDELSRMLQEMVDIPSPTGKEEAAARYLGERFAELGMEVRYQEMEPGRPNMIATLKGTGGGPSLMFNGHLDTSTVGDEPGLQIGQRNRAGLLDGEWVYGNGSSNMKAAFPAYYGAIAALQKAGIRPKGDIVVAGVVGEIEKAPIDQYQGCLYRGGGSGTRWLVMQGVTSDLAIIGEPTGLRVQPGNTGYLFVKISTFGVTQHTWSKEKGIDIHVTMVPKTNINSVKQEIQEILDDLAKGDPEFRSDVEIYLARNGYELSLQHPLVKAMEQAHRSVLGSEPVYPEPYRYSVSSDGSTLDEYGVPAITYGPGGIDRRGQYSMYDRELGEVVSLTRVVECTKAYALAAADLCTRDRSEWLAETKPFQLFQA